jgi:WD40 repeat protein
MASVEAEECETNKMDMLSALRDRNLILVIEDICFHAGYEATANMHRVSKAWNQILSELDVWNRGFDRKWRRSDDFRRLCRHNGWTRSDAKKVNFALTDFRAGVLTATSENASGTTQRIFLGGIPNVFILHQDWLVAGMKTGLIKLWKPRDRDPQLRGTCQRILVGHREEILNLSACRNHLASLSLDCSVRIWDLTDGIQVGCFEKIFIGNPGSGYGFTFQDGRVALVYDDNYLSSISLGTWDWHHKGRIKMNAELYYGHGQPTPPFHMVSMLSNFLRRGK